MELTILRGASFGKIYHESIDVTLREGEEPSSGDADVRMNIQALIVMAGVNLPNAEL